MENNNNFRNVAGLNGYFTAEQVGWAVSSDPSVAFHGLVEVLARQTADERATKGTCHKNKFGFSKKHVTKGTQLAQKFLNGDSFSAEEVDEACKIAFAYRQQLWMISCGAVPENNLDLRRNH